MRKIDFNRDWEVKKYGEDGMRKVNLPDDAMLLGKRNEKEKSGSNGAFFEGGKYCYTKELFVKEEETDKTFLLEFEGVYQNAEVYLQGEKIAEWPYGYTNFFADLTHKLIPGRNKIEVIADNSGQPNSRWYSGGGIYRKVSLYTAGADHIKPEGVKVTVIDEKSIQVSVDYVSVEDASLCIEVSDGKTVLATAHENNCILTIENAKCWSELHPYLYTCHVSLYRKQMIVDEATRKFGLRTLEWNREGFLVNGRSVKFRGACIHHDNGILGAATFRDAEYRRAKKLKEAGFNAIRSAHNPLSKDMLDACDELGIYVMDEAFDMWLLHKNPHDYGNQTFRQWWEKDIRAMIDKDYNHPSVVMYSIGNEISELGLDEGRDQAEKMVDYVHSLDKTRAVTAGINLSLAQMARKTPGGFYKDGDKEVEEGVDDTKNIPTSAFFNELMNRFSDVMDKNSVTKGANQVADSLRNIFDVTGYNYASARYEQDAKEYPDQVTVGAETMPGNLYRNWQKVERLKTLAGDFIWTGYDYLGEAGIGVVRYKDKKTKEEIDPGLIICGGPGVIDICGKMRPEVNWNKSVWHMENKVTIAVEPYNHVDHYIARRVWRKHDTVSSWDWDGCEGKRSMVFVYTDAHEVSLWVNGKKIGRRKVKENRACFKRVKYEPGTITAISYDENGVEKMIGRLNTGIGNVKIRLTADKQNLRPNGQDLAFIDIDLVGENGVIKSNSDRKLKVEVTGAGNLQALGSARPNMAENFYSDTHTTFLGKALAVVRASYESGEIYVKVSGEGLMDQKIKLCCG